MAELDPKLFHVGPAERDQIKRRTKQLIEQAGGPGVFQYRAGVQTSTLSNFSAPSETSSISAFAIVALDRELGAPLMLEFLANMVGHTLVPLAPPEGGHLQPVDVAETARELGEAVAAAAEAAANPSDPAALRKMMKESGEAVVVLHRHMRRVRA